MKKFLLTRALWAKKKIFVMTFLAVFSSFYTMVWGATWKKGGVQIVSSGNKLIVSAINEGTPGVMDDYTDMSSSGHRPSSWTYETFDTLVVNEGVTTIGAYAFQDMTTFKAVKLPVSLTTIKANAFKGCKNVTKIYYSGKPCEWASVDFQGSTATAHPFGGTKSSGDYYFYGSTTKLDPLVIEPTITKIKNFAFYRCNTINGLCVPGTITEIGDSALYGSFSSTIIMRPKKAPTLIGSKAFLFSGTTIYVPTGATGYDTGLWAAKTKSNVDTIGTTLGEFGANVTWHMSYDGVLTLDATNGEKSINIDAASTDKMPWYYFRRLVYKVIIKGEATALNNLLHYHYGISEVIVEQNTIPTISSTYIGGTSYASLFNKRDKLKLSIKQASLTDESVINLDAAPWNTEKWDIELSDDLVIDQASGDNSTILTNCSTYVEKPVNVQLTRSTLSSSIYNTFCSPVNMTEEEIVSTFGNWYDEETGIGTELMEYTGTSTEEDTISLIFSSVKSIEAGKPYLFRPANDVPNIDVPNIRFTNVEPSSLATSGGCVEDANKKIDFYGILEPKEITSDEIDNQSVIFLTGTIVDGNQQLTWANEGTLKGMRAYWKVKEGTPASVMAKRPVLQIGNGENTTTDLGQVPSDKIQCTKVLRNGQIYILRGEKAYNLQGIEIDRPNKL